MTPARVRLVVSAAVLCAWCGWVSGFHRATDPARVTWGISLAGVVAVDVLLSRGRGGRHPGLRVEPVGVRWPPAGTRTATALAGASPWVILGLMVLTWDILGLDTSRRTAHLTISALTQAFRPLNAAMLFVWMAVGIGYGFTRARSPRDPGRSSSVPSGSPATWGTGLAGMALASPRFGGWLVLGLLLPNNRGVGVAFWLAVVAVAVLIDALARRSGGRVPDSEQMLRLITSPPAANAFWVVAWTYAGYHLFAH